MSRSWQWNKSLETGYDEIDSQHKELLNRVNEFMEAISEGKKEEVILETITFLEQYVMEHFYMEEQIQRKHKYPEYKQHKKMHDEFIMNLKDLKDKLMHTGITPEVTFEIGSTLSLWLVEHIGMKDKALADFLTDEAD